MRRIGSVASSLHVEDRQHEQRLLWRALAQQRTLLQVTLQPGVHAAHNHPGQGEGLRIAADDRHLGGRCRSVRRSK